MSLTSNRYEIALSNKVLNIHFGKGAAKLEVEKKLLTQLDLRLMHLTPGAELVDVFFDPNFDL